MSRHSEGWMILLEKGEKGSANNKCEDIDGLSMNNRMTGWTPLAKVDESVTFKIKPNGNDEYGCHLKIKNVTAGHCPVIFKIKTTSPGNYRVQPTIAVIEAGGTAKVRITSLSGLLPEIIRNDRFQVQVRILSKEALAEDDCKSGSSCSNFDELNATFKMLFDQCDVGVQTFKVNVYLEPRAPPPICPPVTVGIGEGDWQKGIPELYQKTSDLLAETRKLTRQANFIPILLCVFLALVLLLIGVLIVQLLNCPVPPSCDTSQKLCPNLVRISEDERPWSLENFLVKCSRLIEWLLGAFRRC